MHNCDWCDAYDSLYVFSNNLLFLQSAKWIHSLNKSYGNWYCLTCNENITTEKHFKAYWTTMTNILVIHQFTKFELWISFQLIIWMLPQVLNTWLVHLQSYLKLNTYSPGSNEDGIRTLSIIWPWSGSSCGLPLKSNGTVSISPK